MCGICGIIDYNTDGKINSDILSRMCFTLKHRGPDDEGIYINKASSVGLGHRRLSIIDLSSAGHQPMANEDKTIWIILNGEIYNYLDLKSELISKGHEFKSHTDTETIIHLYEEYGQACVKFLRGMFAFAIWDERKQSLLLARDRVGKKPLIYSYVNGVFCFASEFASLLESNLISKEVNYEAIHYYLTFGYIPAPLTIYKNVFKLSPAHSLILSERKITIEQYWQLDYSKKVKISEAEAAEEVLRLLKESVGIRLHSDVPLGVFLSGGIDSSTVVALMSQILHQKVKTFSIGFEEKDFSELKYARNIAERFNTDHHEFIVRPKALEILPLLIERYGEPYADSSCIPTYYVAQQTKQYVTVALNGDGGDELFAGYERYQAMLAAEKIPNIAKNIISGFANSLPDSVNSKNSLRRIKRFLNGAVLPFQQRYIRWVGIFNDEQRRRIYSDEFLKMNPMVDSSNSMKPLSGNFRGLSTLDLLLWTDTLNYLPNDLLVKVDITSMANSLEARSPFLDHKLMEFTASLPPEYKIKGLTRKYILKKTIRDLIPKENIYRRKMGFGVPVGEWFRNSMKEFLCETLLSQVAVGRGYFKPEAIKDMVIQHIKKKKDYTFHLWALLMLELWHQKFTD